MNVQSSDRRCPRCRWPRRGVGPVAALAPVAPVATVPARAAGRTGAAGTTGTAGGTNAAPAALTARAPDGGVAGHRHRGEVQGA